MNPNIKRFDYLYYRFPVAWTIVWMLIEGIVLHMNYTFRGDDATLHSFEFAATIISIILAVVAIIYAYFQTQQAETSAENLASQIRSLRDVVPELVEGVGKLTPLADRYVELHESVGATRKSVDSVGEMMQAFVKANEQAKAASQNNPNQPSNTVDGPRNFARFLETGAPYFPLVTYVLLQLSRKGYDVDAMLALTKGAFTNTVQPVFWKNSPEYHNGM